MTAKLNRISLLVMSKSPGYIIDKVNHIFSSESIFLYSPFFFKLRFILNMYFPKMYKKKESRSPLEYGLILVFFLIFVTAVIRLISEATIFASFVIATFRTSTMHITVLWILICKSIWTTTVHAYNSTVIRASAHN